MEAIPDNPLSPLSPVLLPQGAERPLPPLLTLYKP